MFVSRCSSSTMERASLVARKILITIYALRYRFEISNASRGVSPALSSDLDRSRQHDNTMINRRYRCSRDNRFSSQRSKAHLRASEFSKRNSRASETALGISLTRGAHIAAYEIPTRRSSHRDAIKMSKTPTSPPRSNLTSAVNDDLQCTRQKRPCP